MRHHRLNGAPDEATTKARAVSRTSEAGHRQAFSGERKSCLQRAIVICAGP
jgi:hypothetical protein